MRTDPGLGARGRTPQNCADQAIPEAV